ncbi:hypothetical protein B0T24DRAFT_36373 [Lasiosphaeria ovina]|uniref:FAD-binding domain-containing protein n=1 Tax=Lasiosphaeria ovina TaxID=92902 RepID=A0AAE0NKE7_9PEZI|nr:hypothetical protein B0T24DRAFT_36373 [Lasiosphaeria ovina]
MMLKITPGDSDALISESGVHNPSTRGLGHLGSGHSTPLNIVIIGAGIGGLTAAIGLRRNGHNVQIFEQSRLAGELGAAVHLAPNANGILRRWGILGETFGAITMDGLVERASDGRVIKNLDLTVPNARWQHPWHLVHRASLQEKLKWVATSSGEGTPVRLVTSQKAVNVDPEQGVLILENGTTVAGDVVIGADGIYSTARKNIRDAKVFGSGKAAFRFLIPREVAEADTMTEPLVKSKNTLVMWFGDDRRVVMYPCNDNLLLNFVCIHPDTESQTRRDDGWNKQASLEQVLKVYRDFDPALKALMSKVDPSTIKVWQLLDMEKMPTWSAGKLVLLGDAAHPFTPHQGQGCGQAIEDAAALAVVLPRETASEELPERLKLYEQIRSERAHAIQQYSRLAGQDWQNGQPAVDMMAYTNFNFGHDEIDHARNIFKRWMWAKNPGAHRRVPVAFGPFSATTPRPANEHGQGGPATTATITFKTSRTFLETLFPTAQFRFRDADTVATASFSITSFPHVTQLDGSEGNGHARLGLYMHGVQYAKNDGTAVDGIYLAVLLESWPDSAVASHERPKFPTACCDIRVTRPSAITSGGSGDSGYRATAGWHGATFAEFVLPNLVKASGYDGGDTRRKEQGGVGRGLDKGSVLAYRYVPPAGGEPEQSEAGHACVLTHMEREEEGHVLANPTTMAAEAEKVKVSINALDWETLPTLHHIAATLAEIPIYDILEAKVVEGEGGLGGLDTASCRRIE